MQESDARAAIEAHVKTTRWLRRGIAQTIAIESIKTSGAIHVRFESFVESRTTVWTHEPHSGGEIDGPENGEAPDKWDIAIASPALFTPIFRANAPVPHTARVETCHTCSGIGSVSCGSCGGDGKASCSQCGGSGSVTETRTATTNDASGAPQTTTTSETITCSSCSGSGSVQCTKCHGTGRVTCDTCGGAKQLKHFQRVDIEWRVIMTERVLERTGLPDNLVRSAPGDTLLTEEEATIEPTPGGQGGVGPFRGGPMRLDTDVDAEVNATIQAHQLPQGTKLHRQRLTVRGVPVHEVQYVWKKEPKTLFVYGHDRAVHAPGFPRSATRIAAVSATGAGILGLIGAWMFSVCGAHHVPPPPPPIPPVTVAPPPPPTPTLPAAAGPRPNVSIGQSVIELRTDPPGYTATVHGTVVGPTPTFIAIDATLGPPCQGGTCSPGTCSGGACVGGACTATQCDNGSCASSTCVGATCQGTHCVGQTCTDAKCPKNYRCTGASCSGATCVGAGCEGTACVGVQCVGETCRDKVCAGGVCTGGKCAGPCGGGSCVGGTCGGGQCEPVTKVVLTSGTNTVEIELGPSDPAVVERRLPPVAQ